MRGLCGMAAALALATLVGCSGSGTSGGPAKTNASQQEPIGGQSEDTFSLHPPGGPGATHIKQGAQTQITISIERGKNFQEDVQVKFVGLPSGVTIDPPAPEIKKSDEGAKVTLKAADDAAPTGTITVRLIGHPTKGADAESGFFLAIDKK